MRCAATLVRRNTLPEVAGGSGLIRLYDIPDFCGVALVDQLPDRNADKIWIAKKSVSIDIGVAHRLDFVMQRLRGSPTEVPKWISLQDVQHLTDGNAACTGWGRRDHVI